MANGLGYKVYALPDTLRKSGDTSQPLDAFASQRRRLDLYGFESYPELEFLKHLIQISGIGPKSAMGILGIAPLDTIKKAIASGEISYLTKVSGIGKKRRKGSLLNLGTKWANWTNPLALCSKTNKTCWKR